MHGDDDALLYTAPRPAAALRRAAASWCTSFIVLPARHATFACLSTVTPRSAPVLLPLPSPPLLQYFGIFVEDVEDPTAPAIDAHSEDAPPYAGLPKTPRPLQNENFMGDVVTVKVRQNQPFKFVFKRKIFLKNVDGPSEDPMFERLTYLQVRARGSAAHFCCPCCCLARPRRCCVRSPLLSEMHAHVLRFLQLTSLACSVCSAPLLLLPLPFPVAYLALLSSSPALPCLCRLWTRW